MPYGNSEATETRLTTRAERAKLRLLSEFFIWLLTGRLPERAG